jgi:rare lipoprotein A
VGGGGGYYKDDGPDDNPPANLDLVPDAMPQLEPLASGANKPYVIFGKRYVPDTSQRAYQARGMASWYGKKFHGARTSNGEIYDMYAMTAAHPTMPIPSYARVTRVSTGKTVIVRVNDRGPFHSDRLIDLSYTAAHKLGIIGKGSAEVVVELLMPAEIARIRAERNGEPMLAAAPAPATRSTSMASTDYTPEIEPVAMTSPVQPVAMGAPMQTLAPLQAAPQSSYQAPAAVNVPANMQPTRVSTLPASGVFLQLGAFSGQRNAEDLIARVQAQAPDVTESLRIVSTDNIHRVHLGPYPDRQAAAAAAQRLQASTSIVPVIIIR